MPGQTGMWLAMHNNIKQLEHKKMQIKRNKQTIGLMLSKIGRTKNGTLRAIATMLDRNSTEFILRNLYDTVTGRFIWASIVTMQNLQPFSCITKPFIQCILPEMRFPYNNWLGPESFLRSRHGQIGFYNEIHINFFNNLASDFEQISFMGVKGNNYASTKILR